MTPDEYAELLAEQAPPLTDEQVAAAARIYAADKDEDEDAA